MQAEEETEGIIALRRLQNNELKARIREEVENSNLPEKPKKIFFYIAKHNSFKATPSSKEIRKKFKIGEKCYELQLLKDREMAFNITMPEIVKFYGLDYLNFHTKYFSPPPHLSWLKQYLDEFMIVGRGGNRLPWYKRIEPERVRSGFYDRHWIATLKDENGLPCYIPLGLHIPKQ